MAQQHGDTEPQCYGLDFGPDKAFYSTDPILFDGGVNDPRPAKSPPLTWFYQTSLHIINDTSTAASSALAASDGRKAKALSMFAVAAAVVYGQGHIYTFSIFLAPLLYDTVGYYTFSMPFNGPAIRIDCHTHMSLFKEAYLWSYSDPTGLGLIHVLPKGAGGVLNASQFG